MPDDEDLFRQAMQGVDPRLSKTRVSAVSNPVTLDREALRKNAEHHPEPPQRLLTLGEVEQLLPGQTLSWKQDGIQNAVFRKLKQGGYSVDQALDLHGLNVKESSEAVLKCMAGAANFDWRMLLIAHGRGEKSQTPARLKSYLAHWLVVLPQVLAFHSALPRDGGTGAVYVLLKKSKNMKQKNSENYPG